MSAKPIRLRSKFNGKCKNCNSSYSAGDFVMWTPGQKGAECTKCSGAASPKIMIDEISPGFLELSFPYDEDLLALVKSIPGRKYDPSFKTWTVPDNPTTRRLLGTSGVKAEVLDNSEITVKKTLKVSDESKHEDYPFLFGHQAQIVHTAKKHHKLYLGLPAGSGKTLASMASMDSLDAYPVLVVCLSSIKVNWQREIKKFFGKDSQILEGRTPKEITHDIVIINYDILDGWADTLKKHKFKSVIFDESAYIKNPGAKRTQAAIKVASNVKHVMLLSGTPAPSSPYDLIPPLTILGKLERFGGEKKYVDRYCPPVQTPYGVTHSNYKNLTELHRNLKNSCFISWRKEELLDLPDLNIYDEQVFAESSYINELLKAMEAATITEAFRVLDSEESGDNGAFAKMRSEAGSQKIKSIVEEAAAVAEYEKVIVGVHHREVNDEVFKALSKDFKTVQIIGGMGDRKRQEAIDAFQEGDAQVLVMSIVAGGVGINLQNASNMIVGELPISYADFDQVISRIYRSGQKNKVTVKRLVAPGTIDDVLVQLIDKKKGLHNSVMSGTDETKKTNIREETARFLVARKELLG